jgi:hypothetical protein
VRLCENLPVSTHILTAKRKCSINDSIILLLSYYWWGGTKSLGTAATSGLLYKPQMIDKDDLLVE